MIAAPSHPSFNPRQSHRWKYHHDWTPTRMHQVAGSHHVRFPGGAGNGTAANWKVCWEAPLGSEISKNIPSLDRIK